MEIYKIKHLNFTYPDRVDKALDDINLSVFNGEFVTLCGKSGCGKTTLLKLLKSSSTPFGDLNGKVYFKGKPLSEIGQREQVSEIGFVMQSPENQIVTDKVWHELAFGLESLGYSTRQIRIRVSEMASFFGIGEWFHRKVTELSGGQKQLLNLASVMVMQPSVLILDEPTSQLDPIAAEDFLKTLEKINREFGTTVIISEHRLEEIFPISHKVIVMDRGKIIANGKPQEVCGILKSLSHDMCCALPVPVRVYSAVGDGLEYPLTVRDGRCWLEKYSLENQLIPDPIPKAESINTTDNTVIELRDVWFRYDKNLPDIVKGLNLKVNKGEVFAIVGANGSGKTTTLSLISGLNKPYRGKVLINDVEFSKIKNLYNGILGVLPQNPQALFVKKTVYLDLMEILSEEKFSEKEKVNRIKDISALCRIENLLDSHPYDLSGGEQQRTALAKVLLRVPEILLLDEPTKGLDAHFKQIFADIICDLKSSCMTVVMVSHDIEFCAEFTDRCAMFFDGDITSSGTPRKFFSGNSFYTTSANRMARTVIPCAVLADDIVLACGKKIKNKHSKSQNMISSENKNKNKNKNKPENNKEDINQPKNKSFTKRTLLSLLLFLIAIPLTIYSGIYFFGNRKYYFISILIILEMLIPFFMLFEKKKPQIRELVIISVLCAIAVAGRMAFFMTPQFKPVAALVIIAGVCFGYETGFLVGSVSAFVSNFFFGQGPWTPWQMFSFGLIGFVSGILFRSCLLRKKRLSLCIFGFLGTFIIYGGIINLASVIMWQINPTVEMIVSAYIMGLPFDMVHSISTAVFLWFISEPMIDKIERIKVKYGLFEI